LRKVAAIGKCLDILPLLKQGSSAHCAGASVNRLGWIPLHYAASRSRVDTALLLLEQQCHAQCPLARRTYAADDGGLFGQSENGAVVAESGGGDPVTRDIHGQDATD